MVHGINILQVCNFNYTLIYFQYLTDELSSSENDIINSVKLKCEGLTEQLQELVNVIQEPDESMNEILTKTVSQCQNVLNTIKSLNLPIVCSVYVTF